MKFTNLFVGGIIGICAYLILERKGDILETVKENMDTDTLLDTVFTKVKATDQSIDSIASLAKQTTFDSNKLEYVRKIYDIAKDSTDDKKQYAAKVMGDIAKEIQFNSNKNTVADYICRLCK